MRFPPLFLTLNIKLNTYLAYQTPASFFSQIAYFSWRERRREKFFRTYSSPSKEFRLAKQKSP